MEEKEESGNIKGGSGAHAVIIRSANVGEDDGRGHVRPIIGQGGETGKGEGGARGRRGGW